MGTLYSVLVTIGGVVICLGGIIACCVWVCCGSPMKGWNFSSRRLRRRYGIGRYARPKYVDPTSGTQPAQMQQTVTQSVQQQPVMVVQQQQPVMVVQQQQPVIMMAQ